MMTVEKHKGLTTMFAIVFLTILTVLGLMAASYAMLSEKISYNVKDKITAFQSAESALNDAEQKIKQLSQRPETCIESPCVIWEANADALTDLGKKPNSWWKENAQPFSSPILNVAAQPRYVVELYAFVPYDLSPEALARGKGYYYFRITSHGVGLSGQAVSTIQSIYGTEL